MSLFKRQLHRLPDETLFDLENRLRDPPFMGVPIGLTLTSYLNTRLPANAVSAFISLAGWARFMCFGQRGTQPLPPLEKKRVLLTWLADTPRLNDMLMPVIEELGGRACNVIGGDPAIAARLSVSTGYCTKSQICGVRLRQWRRDYLKCCTAWHRAIWGWLRDHHLPLWLFPGLAYAVAVRSLYVYGSYQFLDQVQPSVIVADSEHNHPWACLVLAARERRIPTVQMIHCAIYTSYIFYPLLSDVALCWGEQHREQMVSFGVESERLLITGCQRLSRELSADGRQVRLRLGLPTDKPIILLATNSIARGQWRKLFTTFADALARWPEVQGAVRLHPVEKAATYLAETSCYPQIRVFETNEWTLQESLAACDIVVNHNSGFGNDALVMNRPVIILDVLDEPLTNGQVLIDKAGCPVAHNAEDLRSQVARIIRDGTFRQALHEKAESYVKWFCNAFGYEAARNVANVIRSRMRVGA